MQQYSRFPSDILELENNSYIIKTTKDESSVLLKIYLLSNYQPSLWSTFVKTIINIYACICVDLTFLLI